MKSACAADSLSCRAMALLVICYSLELVTAAPSLLVTSKEAGSETDDNDVGAGELSEKAWKKPQVTVIKADKPKVTKPTTTTTTTTTTTPTPAVSNETLIKKVDVIVVYESHCPYSRRFIYKQLWPTYQKMEIFMKLTILPFGKAHVDNVTAENPHITCQHGSNECLGNMMETCVLHVVKEQMTALKILACMSTDSQPHLAGPRCVEGTNVKWSTVQECVDKRGTKYLLEMGVETWKVQSHVARVPLVVVDGMMDNYVEYYAQKDMMKLLCEHIPDDEYSMTPCPDSMYRRRRRR